MEPLNKIKRNNNLMTLYHGSIDIIEIPNIDKCNVNNDYGKAFYCTEDKYESDLWASSLNSNVIYTNEYTIDTSDLKILKIDKDYVITWIAILLSGRVPSNLTYPVELGRQELIKKYFTVDLDDYDIIVGYRADDSYFKFVTDFLKGHLNVKELKESMELGKLGYQVAIRSEKAFSKLKFIKHHNVDKSLEVVFKERDKRARNFYLHLQKQAYYEKGITIKEYLG